MCRQTVALRTEGVDRNASAGTPLHGMTVALRTEGVDRNTTMDGVQHTIDGVALRTEGVDRN